LLGVYVVSNFHAKYGQNPTHKKSFELRVFLSVEWCLEI